MEDGKLRKILDEMFDNNNEETVRRRKQIFEDDVIPPLRKDDNSFKPKEEDVDKKTLKVSKISIDSIEDIKKRLSETDLKSSLKEELLLGFRLVMIAAEIEKLALYAGKGGVEVNFKL